MEPSSENFWQIQAERLLKQNSADVIQMNAQFKLIGDLEMKVRQQEAIIRSYKIMIETMSKMDMVYAPIQYQYTPEPSKVCPQSSEIPGTSLLSVGQEAGNQSESLPKNSIVYS
jgi:hypothetical protein